VQPPYHSDHKYPSYGIDFSNIRAGVLYWQRNEETSVVLSRLMEYLGSEVVNFMYNESLVPDLDIVLVRGPYGSLVPLVKQLIAQPDSKRPSLLYMMSEQLCNPELPEWFRYGAGMLRSRLERAAYVEADNGKWGIRSGLSWLTRKAYRHRYYGDLYWMQRAGVLSKLIVSSYWTADFLRTRGFDPIVLPLSHHPDQWDNLDLERDIPVLWLGKPGSTRRHRLLRQLRADLQARGVEMLMIDGIEHPYVFGKERTLLLSRTKIVVNLVREKWDDNSMRFALAAPRKALIVSEPAFPHTDFVPGVHLVEVTVDRMADTICYYLANEKERRQIVERAYQLITKHSRVKDITRILQEKLRDGSPTKEE
jgi:hypothetical protein